jgi:hypothetical protein
MTATIHDLAAHRRDRQQRAKPLRPGPSEFAATRAKLQEDYYLADAVTGDDWQAHLWALQSVLDEIAASERPRDEARYLSAAVTAALTRAMKRKGKK